MLFRSQTQLPWGLKQIMDLASGDWKNVRVFVGQHLPWAAEAMKDGDWEDDIGFWPWNDLLPLFDCSPPPDNDGTFVDTFSIPGRWHSFLMDNGIGQIGHVQQWCGADQRLAEHATAILESKTIAEAMKRVLQRPLSRSERKICPEKTISKSDKAWAEIGRAHV